MRVIRLLLALAFLILAAAAPVHAGRSCQENKPDALTV